MSPKRANLFEIWGNLLSFTNGRYKEKKEIDRLLLFSPNAKDAGALDRCTKSGILDFFREKNGKTEYISNLFRPYRVLEKGRLQTQRRSKSLN